MKLLILALFSSTWAAELPKYIEFRERVGLEDINRVEDGGSIKAALQVALTQVGIDNGFSPDDDLEIILKIDGKTAIKAEHNDDTIIYRAFQEDNTALRFAVGNVTVGNTNSWELDIDISEISIEALDGKILEVEAHLQGEFITTTSEVHVWRRADSVELVGIETSVSESNTNATNIASCSVAGAHPAPDSVTMSIGSNAHTDIPIVNGTATLSLTPAYLTPYSSYDQHEVSCSFDIVVAGMSVTTEASTSNANASVFFDITYATGKVDATVTQDGLGLESFEGDMWVQSGADVNVKCSADGNPRPDIHLSQDGDDIASGQEIAGSLTTLDHKSDSIINDNTEFTCEAGGVTGSYVIRTYKKGTAPTFSNSSSHLIFTEDDPISITCSASGWFPAASIVIKEESGAQQTFDGVKATTAMSGNYTCTATNHFDRETSVNMEITVNPRATSAGGPSIIVIIIIIVVVLVLVGGLGFFIWKKKQEKGNDGTPAADPENPAEGEALNTPPNQDTRPSSSSSSSQISK